MKNGGEGRHLPHLSSPFLSPHPLKIWNPWLSMVNKETDQCLPLRTRWWLTTSTQPGIAPLHPPAPPGTCRCHHTTGAWFSRIRLLFPDRAETLLARANNGLKWKSQPTCCYSNKQTNKQAEIKRLRSWAGTAGKNIWQCAYHWVVYYWITSHPYVLWVICC